MPRHPRPLSRALFAAALVPVFALAACAPAHDDTFEEEPPAGDVADADTGAGSAIETETARLLEEVATGRVQSVQEIRSEIKLLARTIAALAEDGER